MPKSLIYRASLLSEALRQGEILTGVRQLIPVAEKSSPQIEKIQFKPIIHPYAIIVSQDCDLDWDYTARQNNNKASKLLNSVIFCEISTAQEVRSNKENQINSSEWNLLKSNRHMQYHFLEKVPSDCELSQEGLPELTANFKKAFAIDAGFIYHQINHNIAKRRTILECPYLQDFSQRYHAYQGRTALPAQHESEKEG